MKVKLSDVRIGFTDLWTAVEFKPGDGKPRFNATFLIEPGSANDKALRAAIKTEAANTYGAKSEAIVKSMETNANKFCYQDGDGADVRVTERWTQTRDEALAELRTLSQDAAWLDQVTRHLPASR